MLVPLYGFLAGDTLGIVVLVQDSDKVRRIAESLQQAVSMRVTPAAGARVYFNGTLLDPAATVAEAGLSALDRVDVVPEAAA